MKTSINLLLKVLCLAVYAAALGHVWGVMPAGVMTSAPWVALALLAIHALEVVVVFKAVRLYPGPLALSVVLTLLFGLLHWKPLLDAQRGKPGQA